MPALHVNCAKWYTKEGFAFNQLAGNQETPSHSLLFGFFFLDDLGLQVLEMIGHFDVT